jgi:hypothetical protein
VASARGRRGFNTEDQLAAWYQSYGWDNARPPERRGQPGRDILGMPGLAPEVKARANFDPLAWTRQASKNAGDDMPMVVLRANGQGEAQIAEWLVIRQLGHDTHLLGLAKQWLE